MKRKKKGGVPFQITALILIAATLVALTAICYLAVEQLEKIVPPDPDPPQTSYGQPLIIEYEKEVAAASKKHNVPVERIYAVILTESTFRPTVVSKAGAVGLMQMLPSTYKEQCAKRGVFYDPEDLKDPAVNIDFCTEYLRELYDMTGSWDAAHLAYNTGIGTVKKWLKDPDCSVDGVTIKNVPKESSRLYLERINEAKDLYVQMLKESK